MIPSAARKEARAGEPEVEVVRTHPNGASGDLREEDKQSDDRDVNDGGRLLSQYDVEADSLYVNTEWDRSVTTLMPREES